ncbi:hypothetical protein BAQU_1740 [Bifidobacterium aquikefiri]|uniref:Uncharacterized protein n=1 Tax=Bifidobacterium aquikefiri TaxID=1653207 RepID=A0A261G296_9BIFI|nr:hypothetical protein BAQU_1740 [Bifidobacterium aquikefiri]
MFVMCGAEVNIQRLLKLTKNKKLPRAQTKVWTRGKWLKVSNSTPLKVLDVFLQLAEVEAVWADSLAVEVFLG